MQETKEKNIFEAPSAEKLKEIYSNILDVFEKSKDDNSLKDLKEIISKAIEKYDMAELFFFAKTMDVNIGSVANKNKEIFYDLSKLILMTMAVYYALGCRRDVPKKMKKESLIQSQGLSEMFETMYMLIRAGELTSHPEKEHVN